MRRMFKRALLLLPAVIAVLSLSASAATVFRHGASPIVTFRMLFMTGSEYDPPGKEGLASLTASMLAQGGSRTTSYNQILEALYPIASAVNWQVDKEMR